MRSTDWAKEEYEWNEYSDSAQSVSDMRLRRNINSAKAVWSHSFEWNCWRGYGKTITPRQPEGVAFCVGNELSSRSVPRQVFSPQQSLTSVFGMGTGGPSALRSPTVRLMLSLEINCLQFIRHCRTNYGTERIKRNVCVSNELSSRLVSKQVFSPLQSLTSVFGMGTGGPSALRSLTKWT